MRNRALLSAIIGTIVEYYDYALYGFSISIIGKYFFPQTDPTVILLQAFGVYAAGYIAKPLGAIIFGHIGDKYGRSAALKISMLGIAIPTMLVGLLPGYIHIGWLSPLLLLLARVAQGIFVGGETDGVRIFAMEYAEKKHICFANSLTIAASGLGIYLASLASALTSLPSLPSWSWRLPFLFSAVLSLVVFRLRKTLIETPIFESYKNDKQKDYESSLIKVISKNWQSVLISVIICGAIGGGYHFFLVFFGTYLGNILKLIDPITSSFYTSFALLAFTVCSPLAGIIADRLGILLTIRIASLGLATAGLLSAMIISHGILIASIIPFNAAFLPFFYIPSYVYLSQQFKVGERYRCLSLGHALGSMIFSGSAPFIGTLIWKMTQVPAAPLAYFFLLLIMANLAFSFLNRKTRYLEKKLI